MNHKKRIFEEISKNNKEYIESYVEDGKDLNPIGLNGTTVVLEAANHELPFFEFILDLGFNCNQPNTITNITPLFMAILMENLSQVNLLIKYGAITTRYYLDETCISCALDGSLFFLEQLLCNANFDCNNENADNSTPLKLALDDKKIEQLKLLIKYGAKDERIEYDGTVLHTAAECSNSNFLKILLKNDYKSILNIEDELSRTALMLAAECAHLENVKLLIQAGSDVNYLNKSGDTALYYAAKANKSDICLLLFESGADPHTYVPHIPNIGVYVKKILDAKLK